MYCSASQGIASLSSAWLIAGSDRRLTMTAWPERAAATRARRRRSESSSWLTASLTAVGSAAAPSCDAAVGQRRFAGGDERPAAAAASKRDGLDGARPDVEADRRADGRRNRDIMATGL